jgi:ubiquinone/menaquinone biosynthesis C-methylase UbiE
MRVLDVGCGTGAITREIAEAVTPGGRAGGLDTNAELIGAARQAHGDVPGLEFHVGDAYALPFSAAFDVATAARVPQWLADPLAALRAMAAAAKPGGRGVVFDFNHEKTAWTPEPPASLRRFYAAFLAWRAAAGFDNAIADRLSSLFAEAGLGHVAGRLQHETARRGDPELATLAGIWTHVAGTRGRPRRSIRIG